MSLSLSSTEISSKNSNHSLPHRYVVEAVTIATPPYRLFELPIAEDSVHTGTVTKVVTSASMHLSPSSPMMLSAGLDGEGEDEVVVRSRDINCIEPPTVLPPTISAEETDAPVVLTSRCSELVGPPPLHRCLSLVKQYSSVTPSASCDSSTPGEAPLRTVPRPASQYAPLSEDTITDTPVQVDQSQEMLFRLFWPAQRLLHDTTSPVVAAAQRYASVSITTSVDVDPPCSLSSTIYGTVPMQQTPLDVLIEDSNILSHNVCPSDNSTEEAGVLGTSASHPPWVMSSVSLPRKNEWYGPEVTSPDAHDPNSSNPAMISSDTILLPRASGLHPVEGMERQPSEYSIVRTCIRTNIRAPLLDAAFPIGSEDEDEEAEAAYRQQKLRHFYENVQREYDQRTTVDHSRMPPHHTVKSPEATVHPQFGRDATTLSVDEVAPVMKVVAVREAGRVKLRNLHLDFRVNRATPTEKDDVQEISANPQMTSPHRSQPTSPRETVCITRSLTIARGCSAHVRPRGSMQLPTTSPSVERVTLGSSPPWGASCYDDPRLESEIAPHTSSKAEPVRLHSELSPNASAPQCTEAEDVVISIAKPSSSMALAEHVSEAPDLIKTTLGTEKRLLIPSEPREVTLPTICLYCTPSSLKAHTHDRLTRFAHVTSLKHQTPKVKLLSVSTPALPATECSDRHPPLPRGSLTLPLIHARTIAKEIAPLVERSGTFHSQMTSRICQAGGGLVSGHREDTAES